MNSPVTRTIAPRTTFVAMLALTTSIVLIAGLRTDDKKPGPDSKPTQLSQAMIGTWPLAGTPDKEEATAAGYLKFFTGKHWSITQADEAGKVLYHHGGTYTLDGDEYVETVKYANENTAQLIGTSFKFKIKVEGDKYTQIGVGNPYSQVWKRAK